MPDDEVLKLIGDERPDLLVMFGTLASGAAVQPAEAGRAQAAA